MGNEKMDKQTHNIAMMAQSTAEKTQQLVESMQKAMDDRAEREREDRREAKRERERLAAQVTALSAEVHQSLTPVMSEMTLVLKALATFLDKHSGPPQQTEPFNWKWAALAMAALAAMLLSPIIESAFK